MPFSFRIFAISVFNIGVAASVAVAAVPSKTAPVAKPVAPATAPSPAQAVPIAAPATAPVAPAKPEMKSISVTRVVGEAGPRIVTSREVRINDAIGQVLAPVANAPASGKRILSVEDPAFPIQVLKVLDEWTVFLEATVIGSKTADKAEVAKLVKVVTDSWKGSADWERLEASPNEIREIVERKLAAQSLEHLKGDSSLVNVSDAEALQYFKKNRLRFGNLPFENFKDGINAALIRSQTERRLSEWRTVLRKKYRVRNFVGA